MPKFQLSIINNQMLADVFILKDILQQPLVVKALFDTGATSSCITTTFAKQLELIPLSKRVVNTAGGPKDCDVFKLKIAFPFPTNNKNKIRVEPINEIEVVEINDNLIWKVIIGMDIIQQGVLVVSNGNYIFSL